MNRKVWLDKGKLPLCGLPVAPFSQVKCQFFCLFNLALFHGCRYPCFRWSHVINLYFAMYANAKVSAKTQGDTRKTHLQCFFFFAHCYVVTRFSMWLRSGPSQTNSLPSFDDIQRSRYRLGLWVSSPVFIT